jgi:hypothetical protein
VSGFSGWEKKDLKWTWTRLQNFKNFWILTSVNAPEISHHVHVHVISLILADHHCAVRSPSFLWPFDRTHWGGGWERLLELRKSYKHWVLCWGHSCGRFNRVDHFGNRIFPVHSQQ